MNNISVAFVVPVGIHFDGSTIHQGIGLGGSESAVIFASDELAERGFDVHVYGLCNGANSSPGLYGGVLYHDIENVNGLPQTDVLIVSRSVRPWLENKEWFVSLCNSAKLKVLWLHDTFVEGDEFVEPLTVSGAIDEIWTLSDWHTHYILHAWHGGERRNYEVLNRSIWQTRNGVKLWAAPLTENEKNLDSYVYNASVSKGLVPLLEQIWPRVRQANPNAQLTVIGGYYQLEGTEPDEQQKKWNKLYDYYNGKDGITFTGVISQQKIARILQTAGFFLAPGEFPETFGISIVESLAAGTPVITCRFGAAEKTAIEAGSYLIDYPLMPNGLWPRIDTPAQIDKFVEVIKAARNNELLYRQKVQGALAVREVCGWDAVIRQWEQHIFRKLGKYLPVEDFREVTKINAAEREIFRNRTINEDQVIIPKTLPQNRISVIVCVHNGEQWISDCLDSIATQDYDNYRIFVVDDASTDSTAATIAAWRGRNPLVPFVFHRNTERNRSALQNQYDVIDKSKNGNRYIVLIDGDDKLMPDNQIFTYYNNIWNEGVKLTYGSIHSVADNIDLYAQQYPREILEKRTWRSYWWPWAIPYTHLRTFHVSLFAIGDDDFERAITSPDDGMIFGAGGDAALMYALLDQVKDPLTEVRAVKKVSYIYNDINPQNDYKVNKAEQDRNVGKILDFRAS